MATVGDIVQLTARGEMDGQENVNVYHFRLTASAGVALLSDLADWFDNTFLDALTNIQNEAYFWTEINIVNGMANQEFFETAAITNNQGNSVGIAAPAFLAYGVRFNRNGPGTRYSYKRWGGVHIPGLLAFGVLDAQYFAGVDAAATLLTIGASVGGAAWEYVQITGGFKLGVTPVFAHVLDSNTPDPVLTTQNTRKRGRGA